MNKIAWYSIAIGISASVCLLISSCAVTDQPEPEYRVNMEQHLHSGMKSMSTHLVDLSHLSLDKTRTEAQKTTEIQLILNKIETTASAIGAPGTITNYSVINRYMGAFLYDVRLARDFSNRVPPNHFPAYSLVKSCLSCHQSL